MTLLEKCSADDDGGVGRKRFRVRVNVWWNVFSRFVLNGCILSYPSEQSELENTELEAINNTHTALKNSYSTAKLLGIVFCFEKVSIIQNTCGFVVFVVVVCFFNY